jgi:hypothetical protein
MQAKKKKIKAFGNSLIIKALNSWELCEALIEHASEKTRLLENGLILRALNS